MTQGSNVVKQNIRGKGRNGQQTSPPTDTAQQNYTSQTIGKNEKGSVWLGAIHKQGDNTSAVALRNEQDGEHQLCLDIGPDRRSTTTSTSPGKFQVDCGKYPWIEDREEKEAMESCLIHAHNGNIVIKSSNGKIRMEATDIEMCTTGKGSTKGNINITASENFILKCKKLQTSSSVYTKLCSAGDFEQASNGVLSIFASLISNITDSVQCKPSKFGGQRERQKNSLPTPDDPGSTIGGADPTQYSQEYLNTGGWDKGADGELTADDAPSQF